MSDDANDLGKWQAPSYALQDGEYDVIWLDGQDKQGQTHASFALSETGGTVYISTYSGGSYTIIDSIAYPALAADESWGRQGEDSEEWAVQVATPYAPNEISLPDYAGLLFINEFMADNGTTLADEAGEFEDWIELYNSTDAEIDLSGMYMSDDLADPTIWDLPSGTTIDAFGYLLIWADKDAEQGPLHADFKLGASGEEIGLFSSDGVTIIDSIVFGEQTEDISYGRVPDGSDNWELLTVPSPESTNGSATLPEDVNGDGVIDVSDLLAVISAWGVCDGCPEDVNGDGFVNVGDLLAIIAVW